MSGILNSKVNIWMTDSRLLKYQSLLLEGPVTKLKVCGNLNPATFLPEENETPDHDCSEFLTLNYAARGDLMDTPLDNPDMEIFTDGSSFVRDGKRKAGYAVVTAEQVLEAKSLPQGTSAQLAEFVALTRALELSKGQRVNIYTVFKYAYLTLHAHAAIWKERQFKTATEPIKHFREIERLLTAIYYPKEVAVMHCKGRSRDGSKVAAFLAVPQAKKVALYETPSLQTPLIWTGPVEQEKPQYTQEELERYEKRGAKITDEGWSQSEDGQLTIPGRGASSSSLSAIRVVSSAYLRLLIFLLAILIPACPSSSLAFCLMFSAYKLNKQGDNIHP